MPVRKSDEKMKITVFRMLLEFTCEDIPYVTNLENLPLFEAKLEYIYRTLAKVFSWCFNGIGDCMGLIILNHDPELASAEAEEKQIIVDSIRERLEAIYEYVSEHGCDRDDVISTLSITLDMAARLGNDDILAWVKKIAELP